MSKLLTIPEVAEKCRTSPATVRYWRQTGTGPRSMRVGRRVLFREEDVQAFLDRCYGLDEHGGAVSINAPDTTRAPRP
ncbi:helix-turn-helix domain-containing protein [Demequina sp. SYSU T00192]|uniref:Helix-turn-helix domain-containing protein n=1 Tax=Demequina litoralis TaxID=3051660 RepID=A0ABT8G7H8_9MICO|nr:helix-turn-helix domain-containing protein [Demequina sp. SYSU T00192]MDN4474634.1 helix-turn-helix domain-containing protein [Demequina sp. SYSU T00192]